MNWDAVGAIAEVLGVIAVVVSLIYVGHQVRQNTLQIRHDNLRASVRGALDTNWHFHRNSQVFDIFRKGISSFDGLEPKEKAHFHSILVDLAFYFEIIRNMHVSGLIDQRAVETNQRFLIAILLTPGGRQWWEFARETQPMPQSAIDYLQALLESREPDFRPISELQPWFAADR